MDLSALDLHTLPLLLRDEMLVHQIGLLKVQIGLLAGDSPLEALPDEEPVEVEHFRVPPHSVPIRCDVRDFAWKVGWFFALSTCY